MSSEEIINYVASLEIEVKELRERVSKNINADRFYAVAFTSDEVARLHGVSAQRVRDYAGHGLIPLHPSSTDAKLLFRASDALLLDFEELKKRKLNIKYTR